uniref:SET domain-containing protein n=1 Tax=Alexandrium monilatum TaxID=311494 RepID=A0A7S4Q0H3_9DINO
MARGLAPYLSRHCRRRRIWTVAKVRTLGRRSRRRAGVRVGEQCEGDAASGAAASGERTGVDHVGIACPSVDAAVDLLGMWSRLEPLLDAPALRESLSSARLGSAVPILLANSPPGGLHALSAAVLLGQPSSTEAVPRPSPPSDPRFLIREDVQIREGASGRGLFAEREIPARSTILVEKPAVAVLDLETHREKPWADLHRADTSSLACGVAAELAGPSGARLLGLMAPLHPQEGCEIPAEPAGAEEVEDVELEEQMRSELSARFSVVPGGGGLGERMEAVARLNGLGYHTNGEQLCYTEDFQWLTGTALCLVGSAFNHSCAPNVARFAIGDVLIFRTIRRICAGEELFISYIESETLSEHRSLRRQALDRDFTCMCSKCSAEDQSSDTEPTDDEQYFFVDAELQAELAAMQPNQRIEICRSLLAGKLPAEFGCEEDEDGFASKTAVRLLLKDAQELRAVLGLALTQIGCYADAWHTWVDAARSAAANYPPYDEALYVYALHAALCAANAGAQAVTWAGRHLRAAVELFWGSFGADGSLDLFRRRCAKEIDLALKLTPGREARERQEELLSRLDVTQLARMAWPEIQAEVLGWHVLGQASGSAKNKRKEKEKPKPARTSRAKVHAAFLAKPKALVVNGLRVLP